MIGPLYIHGVISQKDGIDQYILQRIYSHTTLKLDDRLLRKLNLTFVQNKKYIRRLSIPNYVYIW